MKLADFLGKSTVWTEAPMIPFFALHHPECMRASLGLARTRAVVS